MNYDWLYLCSDPAKLHITLDYLFLQGERPKGLNKMIVGYCSHLDPDHRFQELESVVYHRAPGWIPVVVQDLSHLDVLLPDQLEPYWNTGKTRWSLAVKTLIPAKFTGPFLYTDDDVVMFSDPIKILSGRGWGSKGSFRLPSQKRYVAEQIWEAMDIPTLGFTPTQRYNNNALDAGVFWSGSNWDGQDAVRWLDMLHRFSECEYIQRLTTNDLELRCLDQRFLTAFGVQNGWGQTTISNGFAPPREISERLTQRHEFLHYKTSSKLSKSRWMEALTRYYVSSRELSRAR